MLSFWIDSDLVFSPKCQKVKGIPGESRRCFCLQVNLCSNKERLEFWACLIGPCVDAAKGVKSSWEHASAENLIKSAVYRPKQSPIFSVKHHFWCELSKRCWLLHRPQNIWFVNLVSTSKNNMSWIHVSHLAKLSPPITVGLCRGLCLPREMSWKLLNASWRSPAYRPTSTACCLLLCSECFCS